MRTLQVDTAGRDDPQAEGKESFDISMNRPLSYGQYTFYQSNFEDSGHGKSASVLNAAYDPGRFLKYLGSAMVCGGIFLMFFLRAYFFANIPRLFPGIPLGQRESLESPADAVLAMESERRAA